MLRKVKKALAILLNMAKCSHLVLHVLYSKVQRQEHYNVLQKWCSRLSVNVGIRCSPRCTGTAFPALACQVRVITPVTITASRAAGPRAPRWVPVPLAGAGRGRHGITGRGVGGSTMAHWRTRACSYSYSYPGKKSPDSCLAWRWRSHVNRGQQQQQRLSILHTLPRTPLSSLALSLS